MLTLVEQAGASVGGAVYFVAAPALELLRELDYRERAGYERVQLAVATTAGAIDAVTWIAPPGNQYDVGAMPLEALAQHVRDSVGPSGRNDDYVYRLEQALAELGAPDPHITELSALLRR